MDIPPIFCGSLWASIFPWRRKSLAKRNLPKYKFSIKKVQGFHFQMDQLQRQGLMFLLDKPSGSIFLHFCCFIITVLSTIFLEAKAPLRIAFLSVLLSQPVRPGRRKYRSVNNNHQTFFAIFFVKHTDRLSCWSTSGT